VRVEAIRWTDFFLDQAVASYLDISHSA
jgi:hypothetical protein